MTDETSVVAFWSSMGARESSSSVRDSSWLKVLGEVSTTTAWIEYKSEQKITHNHNLILREKMGEVNSCKGDEKGCSVHLNLP